MCVDHHVKLDDLCVWSMLNWEIYACGHHDCRVLRDFLDAKGVEFDKIQPDDGVKAYGHIIQAHRNGDTVRISTI